MSKILVSGFLSRQCNPSKNKRDVMVSWLLAEALRDMGHEVEHRNPTMTEDYEEFDHVFLGLAALHSVGCNRSYGWLAAYMKAMGKVTLYIDDPDTAKVLSGIRVIHNDPWKLTKPFYVYRLEYDLAKEPQWHNWLMQGVDMLHDNLWPTVIAPMFHWGDPSKMQSSLPNAQSIVPIDFSSYIPEYVGEEEWAPERDRRWITEAKRDNRWIGQTRTSFATTFYGTKEAKRPDDKALVEAYAKAWGVLDPGLDNGFFNSRLVYAAQARSLYITKWQNVEVLGEPYALLADRAEELSDEDRIAWTEAQNTSIRNNMLSKESVKDGLSSIIKKEVSV